MDLSSAVLNIVAKSYERGVFVLAESKVVRRAKLKSLMLLLSCVRQLQWLSVSFRSSSISAATATATSCSDMNSTNAITVLTGTDPTSRNLRSEHNVRRAP